MKTFKLIDIVISISLIILFTGYTLTDPESFFIGYFVVGGWQVLSMIVHAFTRSFTERAFSRWTYHRITTGIHLFFGIMWIFYISDSAVVILGMYLLFILLFAAPIMAVYYTLMCCSEYKQLKARSFIQLR